MSAEHVTAYEPLMMFELRVLSGLHQGAALPLLGEQWCIGANDEADLALYDPGIAPRHARLHGSNGQWSVQAQEGLLQDETGAPLAHIADLVLQREFSVGGIRLCVAPADSVWPEEPIPVPLALSAAVIDKPVAASSRWKKILIITLSLLLLALVGLAMLPADKALSPEGPFSGVSDKEELATMRDVEQQLLSMLKEREIDEWVQIEVSTQQITLSGEVSAEQLALTARMLDRFETQFETSVLIINNVRTLNPQLPFKIVQIIGGQKAHVVLADGRRLFFGDEVDGLRLTAIDNHRLIFEGKQRYEVNW